MKIIDYERKGEMKGKEKKKRVAYTKGSILCYFQKIVIYNKINIKQYVHYNITKYQNIF